MKKCVIRIRILPTERIGDTERERDWLERAAGFNALNFLNYALVRHRAARELEAL